MNGLNRTQEDVLNYIEENTRRFKEADSSVFTANCLAGKLNISRNSASQYLNEFEREGVFLKINSRPVYFFHIKALEELYRTRLQKREFASVTELVRYLEMSAKRKKNFEKAVGYDAGLSYEVAQCRMAMEYPPHGLPVLLTGPAGTGKSMLAKLSWEYAADQELVAPDPEGFFVFKCMAWAGTPEKARKILFGDRGEAGLMERSRQGVLYVKEVDYLNRELQDQISQDLDNRRIIFSTTQSMTENLSRQLLQRIPVIVKVPPLESRSVAEKERLIIHYFKRESDRIRRKICISQKALDALLNYRFPGNVRQLISSIQTSCINAYQLGGEREEALVVSAMHLPEDILQGIRVTADFGEVNRQLLDIDELNVTVGSDRERALFEGFIRRYERYEAGGLTFEELVRKNVEEVGEYFDFLVVEKNISNDKIRAMESVLNEVFRKVNEQYDIQLSANFAMVLARMIYSSMRAGDRPDQVDGRHQELSDGCYELFSRKCEKEMAVAAEIAGMISQNLEWEMNRLQRLLLVMKLYQFRGQIRGADTRAMIICHGYSTAGSIADVVNQTLGKKLFDAVDMPMDTDISVIADKVYRYINSFQVKNVLLLVDLGSLETIDCLMRRGLGVNLGIINNVSTRMALDIGGKMLARMEIGEILEKASLASQATYRLIEEQKKEDAILFVSELNSDVAQKVSRLFMNSLPRKIEINLICYEYTALQDYRASILSRYHILFVAGTVNPMMADTPFVYLEDIISFNKIDTVKQYLQDYLDEGEREQFHRNLLKNFSLQNVIEYLTILNADKVLEFVDDTLEQLQIALGRRFSAKTIIGLNIHICCLVERLVTKTPFTSHMNEEEFKSCRKDFIDAATICFSNITSHYGVELPISEIAYIYDYIYHD